MKKNQFIAIVNHILSSVKREVNSRNHHFLQKGAKRSPTPRKQKQKNTRTKNTKRKVKSPPPKKKHYKKKQTPNTFISVLNLALTRANQIPLLKGITFFSQCRGQQSPFYCDYLSCRVGALHISIIIISSTHFHYYY